MPSHREPGIGCLVRIPGGSYVRGDQKNETDAWMERSRPAHEVEVGSFRIGATPVTYGEWLEVYEWALENGYDFENPGQRGIGAGHIGGHPETPENDRHPVVAVAWYDMVKWCNAKSEREGLTPVYYAEEARTDVYRKGEADLTHAHLRRDADGYRLPTEAEWEKAARGGLDGKRWPWGDEEIAPGHANFLGGGKIRGTTPVGTYPPNAYGLYDVAGNVWEACWDWFDDDWYYKPGAVETDPLGPLSGDYRMLRGGSWNHFFGECRVAYRFREKPGNPTTDLGFRLARSG